MSNVNVKLMAIKVLCVSFYLFYERGRAPDGRLEPSNGRRSGVRWTPAGTATNLANSSRSYAFIAQLQGPDATAESTTTPRNLFQFLRIDLKSET